MDVFTHQQLSYMVDNFGVYNVEIGGQLYGVTAITQLLIKHGDINLYDRHINKHYNTQYFIAADYFYDMFEHKKWIMLEHYSQRVQKWDIKCPAHIYMMRYLSLYYPGKLPGTIELIQDCNLDRQILQVAEILVNKYVCGIVREYMVIQN